MAVYHEIEEINYGPRVKMPSKWRVFLCIRHKLLRDGLCEKHIGTAFIMEKTGLTKAQVKNAIKSLHSDGLILNRQNSHELSNGNLVYQENSYCLNPIVFGELYNWYKNNPTVRVYENNSARSYSRLGPVPDVTPGGGVNSDTGGVSDVTPGTALNISKLLDNIVSNNPSSKNLYNNPSKIEESFTLSKEEIIKRSREKFARQRKELGV